MSSVPHLPVYPSPSVRASLSPSQLTTLRQSLISGLSTTLALPPEKRDTPATRGFLSTYAKETALKILESIIWDPRPISEIPISKDDQLIQKNSLLLAEKLASSDEGIDLLTLLDLSIVYIPGKQSQLRSIFASSLRSNPSLVESLTLDLLPALTLLLTSDASQGGLYVLRKATYCIVSFLRSLPAELRRPFAQNKPFFLALSKAYDETLASLARTYGGLHGLSEGLDSEGQRGLDDWERIWLETKVAIIDAFHIILTTSLDDLVSTSGRNLGVETERIFDIMFSLLELNDTSDHLSGGDNIPPTPFLNRSLISDYQHSYDLSRTLNNAIRNSQERDPRVDLLENTLQSLDLNEGSTNHGEKRKNAGALKLLLRSSGIQPGIDIRGSTRRAAGDVSQASHASASSAYKGKMPSTSTDIQDVDVDVDVNVTQILDVLPDLSPSYVRLLLLHPKYNRNTETVLGALLDGSALSEEELGSTASAIHKMDHTPINVDKYVKERRNIFDDEDMDMGLLRIGKKAGGDILRDRAFVEEMKADILRRAEVIAQGDEEEEEESLSPVQKKEISIDTAAGDGEVDLDDVFSLVKVVGDGENSGDDMGSDGEEPEGEDQKPGPETILELAYIRDQKVFERDSQTRRSKARADLKAQTGWDDSQIEGWRIMLERNPRKDKILQKHEFSGNQPGLDVSQHEGGRSRGRGRGNGSRGAGRGGTGGVRGGGNRRGRGGGGEGSSQGNAKERAWKDKNKARQANHDRKRGHDKKMARGGVAPVV